MPEIPDDPKEAFLWFYEEYTKLKAANSPQTQHCSLLLLGFSFPVMKTLIRISAILILVQSAQADQFKVHYSVHGSGKNIIGNADSSSDARRTVQDMIPDAVVTGVNSNTEVIAFPAAS
jgi:hypothetical protein